MYKLFKRADEGFHPNQYDAHNASNITITNLIRNKESFAIWIVNPLKPRPIFEGSDVLILDESPFMLQYASHLDQYGGRTLIQDSINQIGPYVLDRKKDPNNKLFLRQSFERPINKEVRILDEFPGNKVAFFPSYHCVGNPTEVINELKQNKYKFRNWNLTQILESILDKL